MNQQQYQAQCEKFFSQGDFQSNEVLSQKIGKMNATEFKDWQSAMFSEYDKNFEVIRAIIKNIRESEGFKTWEADVDWDKDPLQKEEHKNYVNQYKSIYNDVFQENTAKYDIYLQKCNELQEHYKKEQYAQSLKVSVEDKDFVAEQVIDVYWTGWECDDKAWLVNDNGQMKVVASNHGSKYFADKEFLENKIKEYEQAVEQTKKMLEALK